MPKWTSSELAAALQQYADLTGQSVVRDVPVTGPSWRGWGDEVRLRRESVGVMSARIGPRVVPYDESEFEALVATGTPIHPLLTWSYADRPGFGHLATRQQFLARTWRPNGPVQPIAVVAPGKGRPNVSDVYFAAGYEIRELPGAAPSKRAAGGGGAGRNDPWTTPRTAEDWMLHELRNRRGEEGWWLAEVPVGFNSSYAEPSARRIDAVVIDSHSARTSAGGTDLDEFATIRQAGAEVVEAKNHSLRTDVIGQVLCARHMLAQSYPAFSKISMTVCVMRDGDAALEWFCARSGIRVEVVTETRPRPPESCPQCSDPTVLPIVYGLPAQPLVDSAERGEVVIGGCVIDDENPAWQCAACGFSWT